MGEKNGCKLEARKGPAEGVMCRKAETETGQRRPDAACRPVSLWAPGVCDTIAQRIWNPRVDCRPCASSPVSWLTRCHQRGAQTVDRAAPGRGTLVSTCQRESATRPMGGPTAARPSSGDCEALLNNLRWSPFGYRRVEMSQHLRPYAAWKNSPAEEMARPVCGCASLADSDTSLSCR